MQVNEDGTGGTRVEQFNWFSLNPQVTGESRDLLIQIVVMATLQVDSKKMITTMVCTLLEHVLVTELGWEEATVYNINPYGSAPSTVSTTFLFDYIRVWHSQKDINQETEREILLLLTIVMEHSLTSPSVVLVKLFVEDGI